MEFWLEGVKTHQTAIFFGFAKAPDTGMDQRPHTTLGRNPFQNTPKRDPLGMGWQSKRTGNGILAGRSKNPPPNFHFFWFVGAYQKPPSTKGANPNLKSGN